MSAFYLLLAEVPHGKADSVSASAHSAGSSGGTVLMGRSISASFFADALGLGGKSRDLVLILSEKNSADEIALKIVQDFCREKKGFGYLCSVKVGETIKNGIEKGKEEEFMDARQNLIWVILNRGYADDAMAAARKAGAGGGTVINARGTAREDDEKFFGMHIVPEKEMLLIVVDAEKKRAVMDAIKNLECLSAPGSGIAFCSAVDSFFALGKK